jgi:hypothetical protein
MPGDLLPSTRSSSRLPDRSGRTLPRPTSRALAGIEHRTRLRLARVQAEGLVQTEKVREIDHLTREAMSGHAMLRKWADTLAGADPFLADELKFFTDVARMGKGEIIADTIDSYCRESRS